MPARLDFIQNVFLPTFITEATFQAEDFLPYMRPEVVVVVATPPPAPPKAPPVVAFVPPPPAQPKPISGTLFECISAICGDAGAGFGASPNRELEERQKLATHFRSRGAKLLKLREHRMTEADCEEILSDLMTFAGTAGSRRRTEHDSAFGRIPSSLGICAAYAVFHQRPIVIVAPERRSYVLFSPPAADADTDTIFLQVSLTRPDHYTHIADPAECARIRKEYHPCMTYRKAVPAIGHYKTAEWAQLAQKLGIGLGLPPGQKKADLYLAIQLFLQGLSAGAVPVE